RAGPNDKELRGHRGVRGVPRLLARPEGRRLGNFASYNSVIVQQMTCCILSGRPRVCSAGNLLPVTPSRSPKGGIMPSPQKSGVSDNFVAAVAYFSPIPAFFFLAIRHYNKRPYVRFHAWQSLVFSAFVFPALLWDFWRHISSSLGRVSSWFCSALDVWWFSPYGCGAWSAHCMVSAASCPLSATGPMSRPTGKRPLYRQTLSAQQAGQLPSYSRAGCSSMRNKRRTLGRGFSQWLKPQSLHLRRE